MAGSIALQVEDVDERVSPGRRSRVRERQRHLVLAILGADGDVMQADGTRGVFLRIRRRQPPWNHEQPAHAKQSDIQPCGEPDSQAHQIWGEYPALTGTT